MEAAVLGALFLLAMYGPVFYAGSDLLNATGDASWRVILSVIGAAGVGALLQMTGEAMWELLTPYGSKSGWRYWRPRKDDFRNLLAAGQYKVPMEPLLKDARAKILTEAPARTNREPWWPGHEAALTTEFCFYKDAPDSIVQWCRRRYVRFMNAVTASAAIVLGALIGWYFLTPYKDSMNLFRFDVVLAIVVVATLAWAWEVRRQAQEMERLWFAVDATTPKRDESLLVKFDDSKPLLIDCDHSAAGATTHADTGDLD